MKLKVKKWKRGRKKNRECEHSNNRGKKSGDTLLNLSQFKNSYYLFFAFNDNNVRINNENNNIKISFDSLVINNEPIGMYYPLLTQARNYELKERKMKNWLFLLLILCQRFDILWYGFSSFYFFFGLRRWCNFKSDTSYYNEIE